MVFVDEVEIDVKAGAGGNGMVSFRREKFIPRGGPSGGNGGHGGSIIIQVEASLGTLADLRYKHRYEAGRGDGGGSDTKQGSDAQDMLITVPPGTIIYDRDTGKVIADLVKPGQSIVAAKGGVGGRGNASFATSTQQTPRFAEKGEPGDSISLRLELKLLADVGIIGYPNVGKSTLISKVSAAKPKIADYPFTTLVPNLGVVRLEEGKSLVMADIPGLIEGAHEGVGLGRQFLRHVERTRVLIHILDVSGLTGREPMDDYLKVNEELRLFSEKLAALPQVIALNKLDMPDADEIADSIQGSVEAAGFTVFRMSALTGTGLTPLLHATYSILEKSKAEEPPAPDETMLYTVQPSEVPWNAEKTGEHEFVLSGRQIERIVAMTELSNEYALRRFHRQLERMGVNKKLKTLGAQDGDTVRIGPAEFDYKDEDVEA